jgi:hypothetical protein
MLRLSALKYGCERRPVCDAPLLVLLSSSERDFLDQLGSVTSEPRMSDLMGLP